MRICFITNNISLPNQPGMPRAWKISQYLRMLGNEVTVVANRRHYLDENLIVGAPPQAPQDVEGIRIIGVETTLGRRKSIFRRLLNYFSFTFGAYRAARDLGPWDIILVGTPPVFLPVSGWLLRGKGRSFCILEIRDMYPHTAQALRRISNRLVYRGWDWWEDFVRRKYDHIVAVVPGIRTMLLNKGFSKASVTTITNGYDVEHGTEVRLPPDIENLFFNNKGKFIVVYGGAMGYFARIGTILDAAELLSKQREDIVFAFFGEGDMKRAYIKMAKDKKLVNCHFFPAQSRLVVNEIFRRASALVHSTPDNPFFSYVLPNKIFEYHGAGKPIIYAGRGDTAELIKAAASGLSVPPENPSSLAESIEFLADNPTIAGEMGKAGREYIIEYYSREAIFAEWKRLLELANQKKQKDCY